MSFPKRQRRAASLEIEQQSLYWLFIADELSNIRQQLSSFQVSFTNGKIQVSLYFERLPLITNNSCRINTSGLTIYVPVGCSAILFNGHSKKFYKAVLDEN